MPPEALTFPDEDLPKFPLADEAPAAPLAPPALLSPPRLPLPPPAPAPPDLIEPLLLVPAATSPLRVSVSFDPAPGASPLGEAAGGPESAKVGRQSCRWCPALMHPLMLVHEGQGVWNTMSSENSSSSSFVSQLRSL